VPEFHAEMPQATASEGLAQGPFVVAKAEFEPTTLQTKGDEPTNEPPRPTTQLLSHIYSSNVLALVNSLKMQNKLYCSF